MSARLLSAIVSRLNPEKRAGFLAEIEQAGREEATAPYLRLIRQAPTRAQAAAVLVQLRSLPPASVAWSDIDAAIRERWGALAPRWCRIRAAKLHREALRQRAGRLELCQALEGAS